LFRPRIGECDPITVVLEAWIPAYKNHRKAIDAEEVVIAEVEPESVFRYAVAVIAAALAPCAVVVVPGMRARLAETAAYLLLVLWDAAMVDAPIGGAVGLDAAVISAAVALLRSCLTLRRLVSLPLLLRWLLTLLLGWLLMLMLLLRWLLMRLLCGLLMGLPLLMLGGLRLLLMLLPLLRFAVVLTLLVVLHVGSGGGPEKQEQNCCGDNASSFHLYGLPLSARFRCRSVILHHASQVQRGGLSKKEHFARVPVSVFRDPQSHAKGLRIGLPSPRAGIFHAWRSCVHHGRSSETSPGCSPQIGADVILIIKPISAHLRCRRRRFSSVPS
jgi:hypothetical protein